MHHSGSARVRSMLNSCICCRAKPPPTFTMVSKSEKPQDTAPRIPRPSAAPVVQPAKKPRLSPVQAVKQSGSNPAVQQCQPHNKARPPDPVEQKQPPASAAAQPGEEPAADLAGLLGEVERMQSVNCLAREPMLGTEADCWMCSRWICKR